MPGAADSGRRIAEALSLDRQATKVSASYHRSAGHDDYWRAHFCIGECGLAPQRFRSGRAGSSFGGGPEFFLLLSAAILFLITAETRIKRRRALKAIHELRALAHVIDMHQLTKDPERVLARMAETPSSPKHNLSPAELGRYLDYCSEMLSLIGKLAALYVQKFDDPVALAAVNEVEDLTTGLSRKIWQKIMIINSDTVKAAG